MNQEKIEEQKMKKVAFLEDTSGERSFLVSSDNKIYFSDSDGNLSETNKNILASAIEKHEYEISNDEEIKKIAS